MMLNPVVAFLIDYCQRHKNPVNAILHIFGVPAAFYGIYLLFVGQAGLGSTDLLGLSVPILRASCSR